MIAGGDGPAIDCPFEPCRETVRLVIEQARPDDDELTLSRVPMHDLVSRWALPRATCPASLLAVPLDSTAEVHLERAAAELERQAASDRVAGDMDPIGRSNARPEHSKTPHPKKGNGWFTQGGSPAPDGPRPEPVARPRLRIIGGTDRPDAAAHLPEGKTPEMTDNARDRLRALALLSAERADLGAQTAALIIDRIREVEALAEACGVHLGAAETLAQSAVGNSLAIPKSAADMIAQVNSAYASLSSARGAMGQAKRLAGAAMGGANNSAANARTYASSI